jgi:antitoxin HigA-1
MEGTPMGTRKKTTPIPAPTPAPRAKNRPKSGSTSGTKHKPVHPGEVLRFDFMDPMGLSAYRIAKEIDVSAQQLGRILNGTRGVSADLALRLARFFGTSAQVWMGLQAQYDLDVAEDRAGREIEKRVRPFKAA